jgi:S1-C subfamily serine protease
MNWLDLGIILFLVASLIRGLEVGFVRQFFSTVGFIGGLLLGAWLQGMLISLVDTPVSKAVLVLFVVLGCALILMVAGEYLGMRLKFKIRDTPLINKFDRVFGSILGAVTILLVVWLGAAMFWNAPSAVWQRQIRGSRFVATINETLPPAPNVISALGNLINPNVFPQVFTGLEPELQPSAPLPDLGELSSAVEETRDAVVKMQGLGCGGIVEGSGFVAGTDLVVTNAHVVAGVSNLQVVDVGGSHPATVVWFDPELDLAIVRAGGLAGEPLTLSGDIVPNGTNAAVLGYPESGGFTVRPANIMDEFNARGRDIYNQRTIERHVYAVNADIRSGNSGGPLITADGTVAGVIFAQSVSYEDVGYALTTQEVLPALEQSIGRTQQVATGRCAR